jgi:hypothetical protein
MKIKSLIPIAVIIALVAGLVGYRVLSRPQTVVGSAATGRRLAFSEVDHSEFDALLQKYVDQRGLVAYKKWKANAEDTAALDRYLSHLGEVDRSRPAPREAELAYWINAYNALTIKGILEVYPTTSIQKHASAFKYDPTLKYNLWFDLHLRVGERDYNLTEIEHEVLRPMGEPRIHFGLVCAARGCPPLRNRAYRADNLDESLSDNARRFFVREEAFQALEDSRTVLISDLLKWYGTDFAPTPAEQMRKLRPYLPEPETLGWLDDGSPIKVEYLIYDWDLNEQP